VIQVYDTFSEYQRVVNKMSLFNIKDGKSYIGYAAVIAPFQGVGDKNNQLHNPSPELKTYQLQKNTKFLSVKTVVLQTASNNFQVGVYPTKLYNSPPID
jgi:hypothetical protein